MWRTIFSAFALAACSKGAQLPHDDALLDNEIKYEAEAPQDIRVQCNSNEILIAVDTPHNIFNGMVYPMGLSKNADCISEFYTNDGTLNYRLPLRSCNTMSAQLDDGVVEYYNTIVVQPHKKLVTNKGRGFHVRCRYQPKSEAVSKKMNSSTTEATSLLSATNSPTVLMKIYNREMSQTSVVDNVKIGDPLTLVITLEDNETSQGFYVTDCLVQDGLGWGEQRLIDGDGCPIDSEIMGKFVYSDNPVKAAVHFQAHKFPYTASVYYQCSVHLCQRLTGECDGIVSHITCDGNEKKRRNRRDDGGNNKKINEDGSSEAMIEVYSGLYVNEANDLNKTPAANNDQVLEQTMDDPYSICISQRSFALGIAIAGLVLMLLTVIAILVILTKKRSPRKDISTTGSSIYSGPYTNTAYSHAS